MRWDITTFIRLITIISVGLCAATGSVADEKFRVKNLPGLPTAASFDQFAGYIDVGEDVNGSKNKMFFWMMESRSAPASDPVVIWLSGGPGMFKRGGANGGEWPPALTGRWEHD